MRKLFVLISLTTLALFAACETQNEGEAPGLKIVTGTEYRVDVNGGDVYVTYTGADAVTTTIKSGQEFINSINTPATGVIVINFKANTSTGARSAVVEVRADNDFVTLVFLQASANGGGNNETDKQFSADCMDGYYYGEKYGEGADRYAFFLSDQGLNNAGQGYPNGTYYYIDCFSPNNKSLSLPAGVYTFDTANSGAAYTINSDNSQLILTGDSVETSVNKSFTAAKMVVSENKIVLEVTVDGEVHKVTYVGDLTLQDVSEEDPNQGGGNDDPTGGQEKDAQSTLTEDHVITFPDTPRAKWTYEGDWWQVGYSNYTIFIMNKYNGYVTGDTLQLDLITDNTKNDGSFAGKYTISYTPGKNVLMAGFTDTGSRPAGTWYFEYGGGSGYKNYAMIIKGEAEIIDNGDGTHTVILDAYDCLDNHITCNWTGTIEKD